MNTYKIRVRIEADVVVDTETAEEAEYIVYNGYARACRTWLRTSLMSTGIPIFVIESIEQEESMT